LVPNHSSTSFILFYLGLGDHLGKDKDDLFHLRGYSILHLRNCFIDGY